MQITPQAIQRACDQLAKILIQKNQDYGNSVEEQYKEYGLLSLSVRFDDKIRRFKQLTIHKTEQQVKDESAADTTLDLAGYAILGHLLLSSQPEEKHVLDINFEKLTESIKRGNWEKASREKIKPYPYTINQPTQISYHDQDHQY